MIEEDQDALDQVMTDFIAHHSERYILFEARASLLVSDPERYLDSLSRAFCFKTRRT